jgi:hypothetical protein
MIRNVTLVLVSGLVILMATSTAQADVAPAVTSQPLFLIAAGFVVLLVIWLLIRGALSLPSNEEKDEDHGGFGVLEGVDEDDEDRKKKR